MERVNTNERQQRRFPARPLDPSRCTGTPPYRIVDISNSGCAVESERPLGPLASAFLLELPVPTKGGRALVAATIVWRVEREDGEGKTAFRYGLHFSEMDAPSQQTLQRYLDFVRRDLHVNQLDDAWRKASHLG
jgi:c-di-GMP-binding flagellar brake protein YcgR